MTCSPLANRLDTDDALENELNAISWKVVKVKMS